MKEFLNVYMGRNRNLKLQSEERIRQAFVPTISLVNKCLGNGAFRPTRALNAAVFDAVMVGLTRRLTRGPVNDCKMFEEQYRSLLAKEAFISSTETSTADPENVKGRIGLATEAFAGVK